jgi:hypothetical protein
VSATFYDVAYCEGFRMPAVHERFNARRGRRTKTSKGGNRDGGTSGPAARAMGN